MSQAPDYALQKLGRYPNLSPFLKLNVKTQSDTRNPKDVGVCVSSSHCVHTFIPVKMKQWWCNTDAVHIEPAIIGQISVKVAHNSVQAAVVSEVSGWSAVRIHFVYHERSERQTYSIFWAPA